MSRVSKAWNFVRNNGVRIGVELGVNFVLPYVIFSALQPKIGDVNALLASSAPPLLWSVVELIRHRRLDAVSMLALLGIALSLAAFIGTGSVKMLQLRERLVSIAIALVFLGSALIDRPLMYELARAGMRRANNTAELSRFEGLRDNPGFRRSMLVMTLVWGFGILAEAALAIALVYILPIKTYMVVHQVQGYAVMGLLSAWTFWYARRKRREGEARERAAAASQVP